jgi:hypothetical protein
MKICYNISRRRDSVLVDLNVKPDTKIKKGDLLIANEDGVFELVNRKEFLKEYEDKIKLLKNDLTQIKNFLNTYQENMTKLLKGVVENG